MEFVDLVPELLLNIASFLHQADLLKISLTSKRLHGVTEPELCREYVNPHRTFVLRDARSIKQFVLRLLDRPKLAQYVRRVDLKPYANLANLNPQTMESLGETEVDLCTAEEYDRMTKAAVEAGGHHENIAIRR